MNNEKEIHKEICIFFFVCLSCLTRHTERERDLGKQNRSENQLSVGDRDRLTRRPPLLAPPPPAPFRLP
jgi:hypothetical protein